MNVLIHYETEEGPKVYTIIAMTRADFEKSLNSFKDKTGLKDNEFTIQMVSSGI